VVAWREHETEPDLFDAAGNLRWIEIDSHAKRLEEIGGA
jgi:hypothetical protein